MQQLSQPVLADYVNGVHGRLKEARKSGKDVLAMKGSLEARLAGAESRYTLEAQAHHNTIAQHNDALRNFNVQFQPFLRGMFLGMGSKNREVHVFELRSIFQKFHEKLRQHVPAYLKVTSCGLQCDT